MFPTEREINERLRAIEEDTRTQSVHSVDSMAFVDGSAQRDMIRRRFQKIRDLLSILLPVAPGRALIRKTFVK